MMAKGKLHLPADLDLDTVVAKPGAGRPPAAFHEEPIVSPPPTSVTVPIETIASSGLRQITDLKTKAIATTLYLLPEDHRRLRRLERFPLGLNRDSQGVRKGGVLAVDSVSGMRFAAASVSSCDGCPPKWRQILRSCRACCNMIGIRSKPNNSSNQVNGDLGSNAACIARCAHVARRFRCQFSD